MTSEDIESSLCKPCTWCNGSGKPWVESMQPSNYGRCTWCKGSGFAKDIRVCKKCPASLTVSYYKEDGLCDRCRKVKSP